MRENVSDFWLFNESIGGHLIYEKNTGREIHKWEIFNKQWRTTATQLLNNTHENYLLKPKKYDRY